MKFPLGMLTGALVVAVGIMASTVYKAPTKYDWMEASNVGLNGNCSGTYIGDNQILTAWHCVSRSGPDTVHTLLQKRDGPNWVQVLRMDATVQWMSEETDLAVLEVEDGSVFHAAPVCRREAILGEEVFAFGNPANQHDTLLKGIVSKVVRRITIGRERLYIQTDAGLLGGISGGALYDLSGCLIGVAAAGIPGTVIGGAVPVTLLPSYEERTQDEDS